MSPINNYETYISGMRKSTIDKIFFLNMIPKIDILVDFGCADGALIQEIQRIAPEVYCIGYDSDMEMICRCNKKKHTNAVFVDSWYEVEKEIEKRQKHNFKNSGSVGTTVLNLSSVIHEVYSYGTEDSISLFWKRVNSPVFDYVSIRDMIRPDNCESSCFVSDLFDKIYAKGDKKQIKDFEAVHGKIKGSRTNALHFLLKYTYTANWSRECAENYLALTAPQLEVMAVGALDRVIYKEKYILPHIAYRVHRDFGIELDLDTHIKLLVKRYK